MSEEADDIDLEDVPEDDLLEEVCARYCDPIPEEGTLEAELEQLLSAEGATLESVETDLQRKRQEAVSELLQLIESEHSARIVHAMALHDLALERLEQ